MQYRKGINKGGKEMRDGDWKSGRYLVVALALLVSIPCVLAKTVLAGDLTQLVQARLAPEKYARDIQIAVDGGIVTLSGNVTTLEQKERAGKTVAKVEGVQGVKNDLQIAADTGDKKIAEAAIHVVRTYAYYTVFDDVAVEANNGVLTLKGKVLTPWRKSDLGSLMKSVAGVREIRNELEVLPLSGFDDQIRMRVARAIFGDPTLSRYGLGANPSIHIIVQNGNVKLTGVVQNGMDKMLAERAARFAATYLGLSNELRIESKA
jgi:hyperosmotically inducible periplasmic protein